MEEPSGPVPLTIQEKERLKAEYVILQHFAKDIETNLLKKKNQNFTKKNYDMICFPERNILKIV